MPIYEFHCEDCDSSFETLVRPGHADDAQCPDCHGAHLNREMSVFASARADSGADASSIPAASGMPRGGCCGGGCGCH